MSNIFESEPRPESGRPQGSRPGQPQGPIHHPTQPLAPTYGDVQAGLAPARSSSNNGRPRPGRFLREYARQRQGGAINGGTAPGGDGTAVHQDTYPPGRAPTPYSPLPGSGGAIHQDIYSPGRDQSLGRTAPAPYSPMPFSPVPGEQGAMNAQGRGQHLRSPWIDNTMRMVRSWSGRMHALPAAEQPGRAPGCCPPQGLVPAWEAGIRHPVAPLPSTVAEQPGRPPGSPLPSTVGAGLAPALLYRPSVPAIEVRKFRPWKRSRAVRISMRMRRRRQRWEHAHLGGKKFFINFAIACALLLVIALSSGAASAYAYYQSQLPRLQGLANQQISQTSRIYDRDGNLLYEVYDNNGGGRRTPVTYKDIPRIMIDAMTAAEDKTFWTNTGVDPQAIVRAAIQYVQHNDQVVSGASTLTQQLIKNLTNNKQVTLNRKISEAALAIGLTQQYPKWKILEMYFNVSAFGAQELGIESAVEDYFHRAPQCNMQHVCTPAIVNLDVNAQGKYDPILGLARASLLAGMPQNPSGYDPTLGPDNKARALIRQDAVLNDMLSEGVQVENLGTITPAMIQQAEALTAKMTFTPFVRNIKAPHFVYYVIQQLESQIGAEALLNGGYNIYTTLDLNLEEFVENAVRRHLDKPEWQPFVYDYGPLNAVHNVNDSAVVVMSAKTGEILAMDGSADWFSNNPRIGGEYNAAIAYRQPGSSFKPIVYATAFQMGWYPGLVVPDQKTYFPDGAPQSDPQANYHPPDYGGGYHNMRSTVRIGIANSFNIPAVKAFEYAGMDNVVNMARRMGITAIDEDVAAYNAAHPKQPPIGIPQMFGPAMALGTAGVPLLQLTGAYQVFANQGVRIAPKSILDVWDNYGNHLYHFDPTHPGGVQVISPQIAYLVTSILSDEQARAIEFSGDHVLSMYDWQQADGQKHEVAAKTGTTDNFVDNWTLGYTPDVVVGVWSGNADNSPLKNVVGISGAGPIWHSVIERASGACNIDGAGIPCGSYHSSFTQRTFIVPPGVSMQAVSRFNGLKGTGILDWMLNDDVPQQTGIPTCKPPANGTPGNSQCNGQPGPGNGNPTPTPTP